MLPNPDFRFSTDALPLHERLAVWREVIGREYMCLDVEPVSSMSLQATLTIHNRPSTLIAFLRATPMLYTRTSGHATRGDGDFTLTRGLRGGFAFSGEGEEQNFSAGDAVLLPNNRTGTIAVAHCDPVMTVRINGALLRAAVRDIDECLLNRLNVDDPTLRLVGGYLDTLLRSGPMSQALGHAVHAQIVDLLAFGLRPNDDTRERARVGAAPAARFATIRADIMAHLDDMRLSAKTVAQRHGISERYVHVLFEQNGVNFTRFVTEERLKRAMTILLDPTHGQMRISDIAFAIGFGDLTTFNRAFRRRFGDTPSAVRGSARRKSGD